MTVRAAQLVCIHAPGVYFDGPYVGHGLRDVVIHEQRLRELIGREFLALSRAFVGCVAAVLGKRVFGAVFVPVIMFQA